MYRSITDVSDYAGTGFRYSNHRYKILRTDVRMAFNSTRGYVLRHDDEIFAQESIVYVSHVSTD